MYDNFAQFYDRLMSDVCYEARAEYVLSLFEMFDRKPSLLLDLCCGTGSFAGIFAKKGISVIGVDASEDMLSKAKEKTQNNCGDILYLCQNATELDLYGTVDGAVCLMDSLNHITDYDDFCAAISRVSLFLEKDRLFIFDINTVYKAEEILGDNTFIIEDEDLFLAWQNQYESEEKTNLILLDFFVRQNDGKYIRKSENISERAYTTGQIEKALETNRLKIEAVFEDMKKTPPADDSQRVFYVTRKL